MKKLLTIERQHLIVNLVCFICLLNFGLQACTSSSAASEQSIEAIEDAKEPLKDSDCLEGEYFDKGTESCEPLEMSANPENSHEGPIDVPK